MAGERVIRGHKLKTEAAMSPHTHTIHMRVLFAFVYFASGIMSKSILKGSCARNFNEKWTLLKELVF